MRHLRVAFLLFLVFTVLTGLIYPLLVTGLAQMVFPHQANGSLTMLGDKTVGSELIGQPFSDPRYFWGRPSATTPYPYNAANSGGSNLGPTNPDLVKRVTADVARLRAGHPATEQVPVDLVTTSASGLDPHISPASAYWQVDRVAAARKLDPGAVKRLVDEHVEGRQLGVLGEPRVNVLRLNLALERMGRPTSALTPWPPLPSPAHPAPGEGEPPSPEIRQSAFSPSPGGGLGGRRERGSGGEGASPAVRG